MIAVPRRSLNRIAFNLRNTSRQSAAEQRRGEPSAFGMLKTLRRLFVADEPAESLPPDDKITLADVLKHGWFEQWYQPKIELKTMRLAGAEALVRARHPRRGVLPPGVFLPGAKEADMLALTERVIVRALEDWVECAEHGMSIKLAVNVPVSALISLPIAGMVREGRPPAENWPGLILEVTEDEIIHDLKLANDVAGALHESHCTLALDDFGAGYSSIARLRQLPFSELKIDRAYVMNCHLDRVNAGLCEVFVELAKRFGLKSVAEGIETTHESHKLQALGADVGQGYLFAKPMPKQQLIGLMRKRLVAAPAEPRRRSA
jgi:EAL domain-containing protein (putative c-di-GMP-specific phosphodiesterase class I)